MWNTCIVQKSNLYKNVSSKKTIIWKDKCTPMFTATLFTIAKTMEAAKMSINRGLDKEDVLYTYNGILFGYKKEWNYAICSNMDGSGDYHTKWSQKEKEKYYMKSLICKIWKNYNRELIHKKIWKPNLGLPKGNVGGRDKLGG